MTKKEWLCLVGIFLAWRILLMVVGGVAGKFLPVEAFAGQSFILALDENAGVVGRQLLSRWWNFDGIHYLKIAADGYVGTGGVQAFFPLWPTILRAASGMSKMAGWQIGYVLNCFLSFSVVLLFYQYFRLFFGGDKDSARRALLALLVFPTSFYLAAGYNESLFLVLLLVALIAYRRRKFIWVTIALVLLCATRIVGIVAVVALLMAEGWHLFAAQKQKSEKQNVVKSVAKSTKKVLNKFLPLLSIAAGTLGLIAYMIYLHFAVDDALAFWRVQSGFGGGRSTDLVLLPQVVWRYGKMLLALTASGQLLSWRGWALAQELGVSLIFLGVLAVQLWQFLRQQVFTHFKKLKVNSSSTPLPPLELILFSIGAFLLPTLTGNFSSMPRYVLVCLAVFCAFAGLKNRPLRYILSIISALLLILNTALFIQAYWIA